MKIPNVQSPVRLADQLQISRTTHHVDSFVLSQLQTNLINLTSRISNRHKMMAKYYDVSKEVVIKFADEKEDKMQKSINCDSGVVPPEILNAFGAFDQRADS